MLHESDGMRTKRRRDIAGKTAPRLPDTIARLVQLHHRDTYRRGRTKTSTIRVLTTLLDHEEFPAAGIAALYAERWQIEVGHPWHRSSCAAFSWLCSLFLVRFVFLLWRCPAGAVVVAGRACPALA